MKEKIMNVENNQDSEQLNILAVSSSVSLPKQRRVMFKFDNDEPMHLNAFILMLKIKIEK